MPGVTFNDGLAKGRNASSAISKGRFVMQDTAATDGETVLQANSPTSTQPPIGVSKFSVSTAEIAKGKGCSVVMDGIAIVETGSALTAGQVVTTDTVGRAVVASAGQWICGYVNEPAAAAGAYCSVLLADPGAKV